MLPSAASPDVEVYTSERIAEFLLQNIVSDEGHRRAMEEVRELGIDPAEIMHDRL